jgi:SAM-dependent MidA family methyltransferase
MTASPEEWSHLRARLSRTGGESAARWSGGRRLDHHAGVRSASALSELVAAEVDRHGPVPFSRVMELALYHPQHGFYAEGGGRAGRRGDFLTSPEVGPLFGAVVARALDAWWDQAGRPDVWGVVDAGAGPGALARSVLAAQPACAIALRYVLVERSAAQRAAHGERLPVEDPALAFADAHEEPDDDAPRLPPPPPGPIVVSLADLPRLPGPCVVLANELLDNLPTDLAERTSGGWSEVRVGLAEGALAEALVPLDARRSAELDRLAPEAPVGARAPVQAAAGEWLRAALELAGPGGRVVAFDYASTTADLAARPQAEWLRTYRAHGRGGPPLEGLGTQDITCEVAVDQLAAVRAPSSDRSQREWLIAHGIDELVEEGRRTWSERAHLGDLAAVRARSRIGEAEALCDPAGLGAFRVLEWPT